jgi:osmotically inducible protein OsmC
MDRKSTAIWRGSGKEGIGLISSQSKALDKVQYSYHSRFEEGAGTNPEELIAAAHAGCFSMKLSFLLEEAGFKSENIEVMCTLTLGKDGITDSHLDVKAKVLGISKEAFDKCINDAKDTCPVSKALKANITLNASLLKSL